jgi:predicted acyl esterase
VNEYTLVWIVDRHGLDVVLNVRDLTGNREARSFPRQNLTQATFFENAAGTTSANARSEKHMLYGCCERRFG